MFEEFIEIEERLLCAYSVEKRLIMVDEKKNLHFIDVVSKRKLLIQKFNQELQIEGVDFTFSEDGLQFIFYDATKKHYFVMNMTMLVSTICIVKFLIAMIILLR
jgi:hypothetical protein